MGSLDQFAMWQQVVAAALLFGLLTLALVWLLRRRNHPEQPVIDSESASDNGTSVRSDAYAPMFRRIAPPTQSVPIPVTPESPRPSLLATTLSTAPTGPVPPPPTRTVPFTEIASEEAAQPPPIQTSPVPSPLPPLATSPFRTTMASNPQRPIKIVPRTGASIGDISAKPVTASIGTRLSVLSLSVVDRPYAKPQLKPEPATAVAQVVQGADAETVRASSPARVFTRDDGLQHAGVGATRSDLVRRSAFRDMPSGALTSLDKDAPATPPGSAAARPTTSRIVAGSAGESDSLSRFAAEMKRSSEAPPTGATTPSKPLVPEPRPMTATVPIVSPRVPTNTNPVATTGPNTVQLTIGFEIASLQLTPALKLGAVQIRPTSNVVSVQLDATSQATLQRLLGGGVPGSAPAFEIESLQLTSGGKIALITLAPKK